MPLSADLMRVLLLLCLLNMALLAALYLKGRNLQPSEAFRWALFIFLVPLLGPFLTILAQPGKKRI